MSDRGDDGQGGFGRGVRSRATLWGGLGGVLLAMTCACSSPQARIKDDDEGDLVGSDRAGAATYKPQLDAVATKMIEGTVQQGVVRGTICVLGIENKSVEELGDWSEQLYDYLAARINRSGNFNTLSRRVVDRALQEGGLHVDDLLLPRYQRQFMEVLESQGNPTDILLFPKLTSGTTKGEDETQRDYLLSLELVHVEGGWSDTFVTEPIRKEYRR